MVHVLFHDDSASHADVAPAVHDLLRLPSAKKANDIVRCFLFGKVSQLPSRIVFHWIEIIRDDRSNS